MSISFSASSLDMFNRCPRQYYYRYILGLKIPPTGSILIGQSFHSAIGQNFSHKILTEQDLPVEQVVDIFSDSFEADKEQVESFEMPEGVAKDMGISLVRGYMAQAAPKRNPMYVEYEFEVQINGIPVLGRIDVLQKDKSIVELKTSKRAWASGRAEKSVQTVVYSLAVQELFGIEPKMYFDVTSPPGKVQFIEVSSDLNDLQDRLEVASRLVEAGLFPKCSPQNWYCSPEWCGYYQICMR